MNTELPKKVYNQSFYQTADTAVVSFLGTRGLTEKDATVEITEDTLHIILRPNQYQPFEQTITLFDKVFPEQSSYKFTPSKLEITLKKANQTNWTSVDKKNYSGHQILTPHLPSSTINSNSSSGPINPYSSKRDWTKIEIENEEEDQDPNKLSGDESLQSFFQSIYKNADDNTRKAMIKSFQMSGGKCLSTNWNDVKDKDYSKEKNE